MKSGRSITALALLVSILAVVVIAAPVRAGAVEAEPSGVELWVAPGGSDDNDGATKDAALASLNGAHARLCPAAPCRPLGVDVTVFLVAGTYDAQSTIWEYFDEDHVTRIVGPASAQHPDAGSGEAIVDGRYTVQYGFSFKPTRTPRNGLTNLEVLGITWARFVRAGVYARMPGAPSGGENAIADNTFSDIGNEGRPGQLRAWGGMLLVALNGTRIKDNHFDRILNSVDDGIGHEHAVYLMRSSRNKIVGNTFNIVGGDTIRFRNRSNANVVVDNTFTQAGGNGYTGDWYCTRRHFAEKQCGPVEYRSWGNVVGANNFVSTYDRGFARPSRAWCFDVKKPCPKQRVKVLRAR